MTDEAGGLVRLTKAQLEPAAEVLGRAFLDYPMLCYYYPEEKIRNKISLFFVSVGVYTGFRYGEIYTTSPNLEGIAIWFPPGNYPLSFGKMLRSVPFSILFGFARYGGVRMRSLGDYLDSTHHRLVPFRHMYLQVLGVDPSFQGKGYAGKLVRPVLSKLENEGLPCYLETLDERNIDLYEHFGFGVIEKSNVPDTELTVWAMLRGKAGY